MNTTTRDVVGGVALGTVCETCNQPVKRYEAVQRGDGHRVHFWHPECFHTLRGIAAATSRLVAR